MAETTESLRYEYLFKIVLIGDGGVGKSSLMLRFADDTFSYDTAHTIGVDFKIKTVFVDGRAVKLQIWDTAGQERYQGLSSTVYRGAHGIILVYSITDEESFQAIPSWVEKVYHLSEGNVQTLLVGNKCDMAAERRVGEASGKASASRFGMGFLETSAKNTTNVEQAFLTMAAQIKQNVGPTMPHVDMKDSFRLESSEVNNTYCCSYI